VQLVGGFFMLVTYVILLISPGRWQQAKTQQPIGVVGLVIIHVSGLVSACIGLA